MHQQDTFPREIFDIIQKIANLSARGNYIFRGEPKRHCKISSTLYRECRSVFREADLESEFSDFDIKAIEEEILDQVNVFIPRGEHISDPSVLTQLQHYSSQTNLIDFTTDYNIALFFACDSQPNEKGRVIVQKKDLVRTVQPLGARHRVLAQKSVFVQPKRGYIDPNESDYKVVDIPACLKNDILRYLRNTHEITTETIYNDIHGYIRNKQIHKSAYREFYIAFTYEGKAEKIENRKEKHELWDKAIEHYDRALDYNPNFHRADTNRRTLHRKKKENDRDVQDISKALEITPERAPGPYTDRDYKAEWIAIHDPISALDRILESYDYLEYDEGASDGIAKLRVKVKETCLESERDSEVMFQIKNELERATERFYVPILNPVSGSPSEEIRDTRWRYFTLHERPRPRRFG